MKLAVRLWFMALVAASGARGADENEQCGLYLAISSTSTMEETNWGIYAGKDIEPDTSIGSADIGINVPHLRANSFFVDDDEEQKEYMDQIVTFFETFFWVPETIGAKFELEVGRGVAAIPGAGVLAGYNPKLTNSDWNITATYKRPVMGEESGVSHPGRGANTPFYTAQVISTQKINAGTEIFMEFGESWAEQQETDGFEKEDYARIDETVAQMLEFFEKYKDSLDQEGKQEVYNFVTRDVMKAAVGTNKARRISQLLPPNPDDLKKVKEAGGALAYSDPSVYRSVDWLKNNGLCMDNLRPGASTIPNAGRGAFATRKVKKDGLLAPAPLTHFPDKRILNMYALSLNQDGDYVKDSDEIVDHQLFMNYCYGHPQSSMIFFPSGALVGLINHSEKPNAKLVWSKHPNHQKQWLKENPQTLVDEEHMYIGLLMEVVATRDIEEGEEIFIDYGPEWKAAWEKHVEEWTKRIESGEIPKTWPLRANDMNDRYISNYFEGEKELEEPYPKNVELKAFLMIMDSDNEGTLDDPKIWDGDVDSGAYHHDHMFTVQVVDRTKVDDSRAAVPYTYSVRWVNNKGEQTIIAGVPHKALVFVDKPGTSDQLSVNKAFRHYIGIPDDVFPTGPWRNLA